MPHPGKGTARFRSGGSRNESRPPPKLRRTRPATSRLIQLGRQIDLEPGWSKVLAAPAIPAVFEQGPAGARLLMLELLVTEWTPRLASLRRELRHDARHGQAIRRTVKEQLEDGTWPVKAST